MLPFRNTIRRRLLLKSLQYCLVFDRDLDKLLLSATSVQTSNLKTLYRELTFQGLTGVVEFGLGVLHDIGHLFQEYLVRPLNILVLP